MEDEALVSMMLEDALVEAGYAVVGSVDTVKAALALLEREAIDCAVLDIMLSDGVSVSVARALAARGIPFLLATGCDPRHIPDSYYGAPLLRKVFLSEELIDATARLVGPPSFARTAA